MRWEYPWLLIALAAIPILVVIRRRDAVKRPAVLWVLGNATLESRLGAVLALALDLLPWAALLLAVVAVARPQQGLRQSETESRGVDIVLAIDISPSMAAQDFLPNNRIFVAKQTAREFVRQRPHDRIGLVGFAGTAFTQCPLTLDHETLTQLLDGLDIGLAEDGTAIGMGLSTAVARLHESKTPSKVVVLLTDGANNRGAIDPMTAADLAHAMGVKVYAVLVGRGGVVPVPVDDPVFGRRIEMVRVDVDENTMQEIAKRTGGRYFRAVDSATLSNIYAEIDRLERAPIKSIEYKAYHDLGPLLLALALALVAAHSLLTTTLALRSP